MRNTSNDWIAEVKSAEARTRRAEQIAERLLATWNDESEIPPILQIAFAHNFEPAKDGNGCRQRAGAGTCSASSTTGTPMPVADELKKTVQEAVEFRGENGAQGNSPPAIVSFQRLQSSGLRSRLQFDGVRLHPRSTRSMVSPGSMDRIKGCLLRGSACGVFIFRRIAASDVSHRDTSQ